MDRTILVSGFSYYGRYVYNVSGQVAEDLDGTTIRGFRVVGTVLPVSLRRALPMLRKLLEEYRPVLVVSTGLHPAANAVLIELAAANTAYFSSPDVEGYRARLEPLEPEGPPVAYTGLPVRRIVEECAEARGLKLRPSVSIGTYLCNAVGYTVMSYSSRTGVPGGFLHLPPSTDTAMRLGLRNMLPYREILEAVRCVVEVSAETLVAKQ